MPDQFCGGCHCGSIGFSYGSGQPPSIWPIRACQCSFCLAHNSLSTSDSKGQLEFYAVKSNALQKYRFGLMTADFLLCTNCGVYIGAAIETERGLFGIINVRTLVGMPVDIGEAVALSYDQENTQSRIVRREQRWTPVSRLP